MTAGNLLYVLSNPFTRDTSLKFDRKETVVSPRKNMNWDVGPVREPTGIAENRRGLLAWLRTGTQHVLGQDGRDES